MDQDVAFLLLKESWESERNPMTSEGTPLHAPRIRLIEQAQKLFSGTKENTFEAKAAEEHAKLSTNGHFLLQSSGNILPHSILSDYEEALNLGKLSATEVFLSLRRKNTLHLFASSGRFLGLEVFEECLATHVIPKSMLHGSDYLLMEFPLYGGSYYLLIQLDKDFKPVFNLLKAQPYPVGKLQSTNDSNHVIRFNKINLGQMQLSLNLGFLDREKIHSSSIGAGSQNFQDRLYPGFGLKASLQLPGCCPVQGGGEAICYRGNIYYGVV